MLLFIGFSYIFSSVLFALISTTMHTCHFIFTKIDEGVTNVLVILPLNCLSPSHHYTPQLVQGHL
jgi:hypothetical protein